MNSFTRRRTPLMPALCIAILSMFFLGQPSDESCAQETQATTWTGTLDARGTKLRLEIDIWKTDGKFAGELQSLDQGNAMIELDKIRISKKRLSFSLPKLRATFTGKLSSNGETAKGTFTQSGVKLPLTLAKSTDQTAGDKVAKESKETLKAAWVGKLDMGTIHPVMQFRIVELESGETSAYFDSITEGETGFKATYEIKDRKVSFDVASIKLTYRGTINETGIAEGIWSQGGRELPLSLKRQTTEFDNDNVWENRPQRPVGPFPYDAEEVTFENKDHDVTLAGTLTIPQGKGPHPAVILISGSGPQDRDETLMEHKPFLVLADYLSRRGVAVLRYDDRGAFGSTGSFAKASSEDFAHDTSAAVEFLKSHQRINAKEIGLAGHSEGGLIAPIVTQMRDDVAFVVLMAATGVDGVKIAESQSEAMMRNAGISEEEIKSEMEFSRVVMDVVKSTKFGDDISDQLDAALEKVIATIPESKREATGKQMRAGVAIQKKRLESKWMRFFLSHDPSTAISRMKCPVLAVNGSKDLQVLPKLNMSAIKKALTDGGNKDFEIVYLEDLNHMFQKCETGSRDEYSSIQETMNPLALETIGDWIIQHTHPAGN